MWVFPPSLFFFAGYFVTSAINEREKANKLLLNILRRKAAQVLKTQQGVIAEQYDDVTVLFADIVNFTQYASHVSAEQLVGKLNEIVFRFDELKDHHGLEKIKTIGDAYMVAGGLPEPKPGHGEAIAALALDMLATIKKTERANGVSFSLRIGMHRGPVVAGVIGKRKFAYDLWGDTVNIASRMESSGTENSIQVSDSFYQPLRTSSRSAKEERWISRVSAPWKHTFFCAPPESEPNPLTIHVATTARQAYLGAHDI